MPYVFHETLEEGMVEADVVQRQDFEQLAGEYDEVVQTRDNLATQLDGVTVELQELRQKYADAVLNVATVVTEQRKDVERDSKPQTFADLFKSREG